MRLILILRARGRIRNIGYPSSQFRRRTVGCGLGDRNSRHARRGPIVYFARVCGDNNTTIRNKYIHYKQPIYSDVNESNIIIIYTSAVWSVAHNMSGARIGKYQVEDLNII